MVYKGSVVVTPIDCMSLDPLGSCNRMRMDSLKGAARCTLYSTLYYDTCYIFYNINPIIHIQVLPSLEIPVES